jgi:hypothetical protein
MAAKLTITQLAALLRHTGRHRGVDAEAARIQAILRTEYLHQLLLVEDAPSVAKHWPCSARSPPPAPTPRTSLPRPSTILTNTRTLRSSPACPPNLDPSPARGH